MVLYSLSNRASNLFFRYQRITKWRPNTFLPGTQWQRCFCVQTKMEKPQEDNQDADTQQDDNIEQQNTGKSTLNDYDHVYSLSFGRKLYSIKLLSLGGCFASLILAPSIIMNPTSIEFIENLSTMGRYSLAVPTIVFGCGTTAALHLFTHKMATNIFINKETNDVTIQLITLFATTMSYQTNLKYLKRLDHSTLSNVECLKDSNNPFTFYVDTSQIPEFMLDKMGFLNNDKEEDDY